jgi:hypothetical protein
MEIQVLTESENRKETLSQVINRIFSVCKADPHFKLKSEMESLDGQLNSIKSKIAKQESLLSKSHGLTENVKRRIALIQQENEERQIELLETLGSEL